MGMQPILLITLPVKKIKSAVRQHYGDGDAVIWCEWTSNGRGGNWDRIWY